METVKSVTIIIGTLLVMVVLTFALGIPVALYAAARLLLLPLSAVGLFAVSVWVGLIGDYGGPFGFPERLWEGWLVLFAAVFGWQFGMLTFKSWTRAYHVATGMLHDQLEDG